MDGPLTTRSQREMICQDIGAIFHPLRRRMALLSAVVMTTDCIQMTHVCFHSRLVVMIMSFLQGIFFQSVISGRMLRIHQDHPSSTSKSSTRRSHIICLLSASHVRMSSVARRVFDDLQGDSWSKTQGYYLFLTSMFLSARAANYRPSSSSSIAPMTLVGWQSAGWVPRYACASLLDRVTLLILSGINIHRVAYPLTGRNLAVPYLVYSI